MAITLSLPRRREEPRDIKKLVTDHLPIPSQQGSRAGPRSILRHQVEIYDAIDDPAVKEVVLLMGAQTAKSTVLWDAVIAHLLYGDGQAIYVGQSEPALNNIIAQKLDPAVADASPWLRQQLERAAPGHWVTSGGGIRSKRGIHCAIISAKAHDSLRSLSPTLGVLDELDLMTTPTPDGPVPDVIRRGQATHEYNRKLLIASTPTTPLDTMIVGAWEATDQGQYECFCDRCGARQFPEWEAMDVDHAVLLCAHCDKPMDEAEVKANAEWVRLRPEVADKAGFRMTSLLSPLMSWRALVDKFLEMELSSFLRQFMVRAVHDEAEKAPEWNVFDAVRLPQDQPPPNVRDPRPSWCEIGVDTNERILDYLVAHAYDQGHIKKYVHRGAIAMTENMDCWEQLERELLRFAVRDGDGSLSWPYVSIDGGRELEAIVKAARGPFARWGNPDTGRTHFQIVRGKTTPSFRDPDVTGHRTIDGTLWYHWLAVDALKTRLYREIGKISDPDAESTLWVSDTIPDAYLRELTSETLVKDPSRPDGVRWSTKNKSVPNHSLDCAVYGGAAIPVYMYQRNRRPEGSSFRDFR